MGKYITLGKYNKLYKYICYFLLVHLIYEYLFDGNLPDQIKIKNLKPNDFPKNILFQESLNYIGTLIISFFVYRYEKSQIEENDDSKSIKVANTFSSKKLKKTSTGITLIYNDINDYLSDSKISISFICILLTLSVQIMNQLYIINLRGLDFWMFEILFISIISSFMFGREIYKHKKLAIFFITFFPCLFKFFSVIAIINNKNEKTIFKEYKWIIPVGVILFLLVTFLRDFSICKIKYFLEYQYYSPNQILIVYAIYGALICFITSIISTCIKCADKNKFENINLICSVNMTRTISNDDNFETIYYYDNIKIFIRDLWRKERAGYINFLYVILIIFKIIMFYLLKLFSILIIKKLNQVYLICSTSIFYFFLRLLRIIFSLILADDHSIDVKFYELMAELFSIIGIVFYLELVEFNFCGLNYNLKKNITIRSLDESSIKEFFEDDNENDKQRMTEMSDI